MLASQCQCTENPFILTANLIPGNIYYLVLDGCAGDICDYYLDVLDGTFGCFPVISGPEIVCVGDTVNYSIDVTYLPNLTIEWLPNANASSNPSGNNVSIVWDTLPAGLTQVCAHVSDGNSLDTTICLPVYITPFNWPSPVGPTELCPDLPTYYSRFWPITCDLGQTYFWTVENGTITIGNSTSPAIYIAWNQADTGRLCLYTVVDTDTFSHCLTVDILSDTLCSDCLETQANAGSISVDCAADSISESVIGTTNLATADASFEWTLNGVTVSNSPNLNVQSLGLYVFTVTNLTNDCTASDTLDIQFIPGSLIANAGQLIIDCQTSSLQDTITGTTNIPTQQASFQWTLNGVVVSTTPTVIIQSMGLYVFTVTNNLTGCMASDTFEINDIIDLPIADAGPSLIFDCYNPIFTLDGSGSSIGPQYQYQWSGPNNFVSDSISPTANAPGEYLLTVTNLGNGCIATDLVLVQEDLILESPSNLFVITADSCHANTGAITFQYDGFPHTLIWSTGDTTSTISGLTAGFYGLEVIFGVCVYAFTEHVDSVACTSTSEVFAGIKFQILPNPNKGQFSVLMDVASPISFELELVDVQGRNVSKLQPMQRFGAGQHQIDFHQTGLASGTYYLVIKNEKGRMGMKVEVVK